MATGAQGHKAYLGFGKESVWGTKVVPSGAGQFLEFLSETLGVEQSSKVVQGINNTRARTKRVLGARTVAGEVNWEVNAEDSIGDILKNVLPTEAFTDLDGSRGEHVFTPGDVIGSLTAQVGRDVAARDLFGGKVPTLSFNATPDEFLQATAAFSFKDEETATPQTPVYTTENPLIYHTGLFQIDGGGDAMKTAIDLSIATGLKAERRQIGSNLIKEQAPGPYDITGSFGSFFDDETQINKFLAGTPVALSWQFTGSTLGGGTRLLLIELPQVFYNGETAKVSGADAEIELTFPFVAVKASGSDLIKVTLTNSRLTAY